MASHSDPRIKKTKQRLKSALFQLLKNESTKNISIQQIVDTAAITRGTFYLHYHDKKDFIQAIINEVTNEFFLACLVDAKAYLDPKVAISEHDVQVFSLRKGFKFIADNYETFTVIFKLGRGNAFTDKATQLFDFYIQLFLKKFDLKQDAKTLHNQFTADFIVAGLLGITRNWLNNGMIYSPHFMGDKMYILIHDRMDKKLDVRDFFVN